MPADSASEIVKFTISIPRVSCTNAKAKYSSSVVPPDPSVHFYHCMKVPDIGSVYGLQYYGLGLCLPGLGLIRPMCNAK